MGSVKVLRAQSSSLQHGHADRGRAHVAAAAELPATRVELDESGFPSVGNAFIFSALLSELSGSLVELNAASEVVATLSASKLEFPWPVQIGI